MVWIDPDRPDDLFGRHWLASSRHPAPLRYRHDDYGTDEAPVGARAVRADLAAIGVEADGPIRMLTQPRRWGWLFNPITLYFAWSSDEGHPIGAVVEVTNTPWKERHRYALPLQLEDGAVTATFGKTLHVSPFLTLDHNYVMRLQAGGDRLQIAIDVVDRDDPAATPALRTKLTVDRLAPTRRRLSRFVLANPLSTHKVSAGIHVNAARLWHRKVPVVAHPNTRDQQHERQL